MFKGDYHQDAHEFFIWLVNDINESLQESLKKELKIENTRDLPKTWLEKILEGKAITKTTCLNCETVTEREEPFLDLSLDIESGTSVFYRYQRLSDTERLEGSNKFFCDKCNSLQDAEKG